MTLELAIHERDRLASGASAANRASTRLARAGITRKSGEVATSLVVAESTIRTHVKRILMKLGLRDHIPIVIFACETGVNRPPAAVDPTPP